jgi:hypothetical protein
MSDTKRWFGLFQRDLGCYSTGPEYRHLVFPDGYRIAEFGLIDVIDTD